MLTIKIEKKHSVVLLKSFLIAPKLDQTLAIKNPDILQ